MSSRQNKSQNIETALQYVKQAHEAGASWVVLPEVFHFIGAPEDVMDNAEDIRGQLWNTLSQAAQKLKIVLFAGSIAEKATATHCYNTCYVFGTNGEELGFYRKTHLFCLNSANGRPILDESLSYLAGNQPPPILDIDGWRVLVCICFDIRFAGLFLEPQLSKRSYDAIVVPAAFTKTTGAAHWDLLVRGRAIENQAYVIASAQTGEHFPGKASFGHSTIVDPWGETLTSTGPDVGIAYANIEKQRLAEVRSKLPVLSNLKPELY